MAADEMLIHTVRVDDDGIFVAFKDGRDVKAPLTERLRNASRKERDEWALIGGGVRVHWPILDEDLSAEGLWYENQPENPPLFRSCRFCGERTRWDSERCDSCGKERWNDPDDTDLGRELGKAERTDYKIALARVRLDGAFNNLLNEMVDASLNGELDEDAIDADLRKMTENDE
jgi:hypothetical protein